jgi:uncharacterized membrane protein YkvA (DUF1232 family)
MDKEQKDFYQKLRIQIKNWVEKKSNKEHKWAEYILLAPDLFHLLCKLMLEDDIPSAKKVKLAGVIVYFILPIDLLPEALFGPVGYLDDIALTAYVLNDIINDVNPEIVTRNWAGEREILNLIKTILVNSDKMVGSGLWRKILKRF